IVLDNQIRSWPQIEYQKYPDGIDPTNGGAEITGMAGLSEAKNLALVLQTGALPVKFVTIERTDVSATLGKDSLRQARNAAIGGLIVVSLITAVAATRAMLGLLSGFRWFDNPRFMGAAGEQRGRWLQIDFMRRRHLWFAISGVVVLVSAISLATRGLNLGIDFRGGVQ